MNVIVLSVEKKKCALDFVVLYWNSWTWIEFGDCLEMCKSCNKTCKRIRIQPWIFIIGSRWQKSIDIKQTNNLLLFLKHHVSEDWDTIDQYKLLIEDYIVCVCKRAHMSIAPNVRFDWTHTYSNNTSRSLVMPIWHFGYEVMKNSSLISTRWLETLASNVVDAKVIW